MIRTVEAVVDARGNVRLLVDVRLPGPRRALVTILDDGLPSEETALLSERALADWNRPEEDAAWSHLQPAGYRWWKHGTASCCGLTRSRPGN
jgi:hypothetical protein